MNQTKQRPINTQSHINGRVHNDIFRDRFTKNIEWKFHLFHILLRLCENEWEENWRITTITTTAKKKSYNAHDPIRSNCAIFVVDFLRVEVDSVQLYRSMETRNTDQNKQNQCYYFSIPFKLWSDFDYAISSMHDSMNMFDVIVTIFSLCARCSFGVGQKGNWYLKSQR